MKFVAVEFTCSTLSRMAAHNPKCCVISDLRHLLHVAHNSKPNRTQSEH